MQAIREFVEAAAGKRLQSARDRHRDMISPAPQLQEGRAASLLLCMAVFLGAAAQIADAGEAGPAREAFAEGRFVEAAGIAESLGTSEGYALAAESLAIHGHYLALPEAKPDLLRRAMQLAQEAIRADGDNPQAHLQSAHAMGRYTQAIGTLKVKREYAGQVRAAIEQALLLDPALAAAHLSLATWHAEAVKGGGFMARMLFGASKDDALAHYEQAIQLAPGEKVGFAEYAIGLLRLDGRRNREQARRLLQRAIELPARHAHDRIVHERAVAKLAELDT